jgi:lipopolysaccharide export system permease protein
LKLLDSLIGRTVIGGTLLALCVLLALFVFIEFVSEFDRIGQGEYTAWMAFKYVLFSVPRLAYELMPLAALLGSLIGLGLLASNNELIAMRACGVSVGRIAWAAVKAGLLLVMFAVWLGEGVVATAEDYAANARATALSGSSALRTQSGFWTREGGAFVNVRAVEPGPVLAGVTVYEFDGDRALQRMTRAKTATHEQDRWVLHGVTSTIIGADGVQTVREQQAEWGLRLDPGLLDLVAVQPESLSITGLYRYMGYLRENALETSRYEIEFWTKVMLPLASGVMVFAALPFVFGPLRSVGIGQRMLVGVLTGLGFYLLNQAAAEVGLAFGLNAMLVGFAPTLILLVVSMVLMRRLV